jgi:hypothetical protein
MKTWIQQSAVIACLLLTTGVVLAQGKPDPSEEKLKQLAQSAATLISGDKVAAFEKKLLVDRGRYNHYYKKQHDIEIADRGWTEFKDGIRENFGKKKDAIEDPKLTFTRMQFGQEGPFKTCELWASFAAKADKKEADAKADPAPPQGELIVHFIRIKGKWVLVSLE